MTRVAAAVLSLIVVGALLAGCGPSYKSLEIDPRGNDNSPLRSVGESANFRAFGVNAGKVRVQLDQVTWASSNEKVAKVDATGKVTAVGSGRTNLSAKWQELGDVVPVTVSILAKLDVQPAGPVTLKRWEEMQFKAAVKNELGDTITSGKCSWSLSGVTAVANQDGLVKGREPGEEDLTVSCMGKSTKVHLIVSKEEFKAKK